MLKNRPPDRRRVLLLIARKAGPGQRTAPAGSADRGSVCQCFDLFSGHFHPRGRPHQLRACRRVRPPFLPRRSTCRAADAATPTTIDQNYYTGNYVPVFVDIFKAVKSVFVDDTLDVFTRFTGGREYSFVGEKSLDKAIARDQRRIAQPVSAELFAQQPNRGRVPRDQSDLSIARIWKYARVLDIGWRRARSRRLTGPTLKRKLLLGMTRCVVAKDVRRYGNDRTG